MTIPQLINASKKKECQLTTTATDIHAKYFTLYGYLGSSIINLYKRELDGGNNARKLFSYI